MIIVLFFTQHPNSIAQKWSNCAPPVLPAGCTSCLISSPLSPRVFGWLLHFYLCLVAAWGHVVFLFMIFSITQFATTWRGCCRHLCSRCQPPRWPTAVAAAAACQQWQRRRCWQCGNIANEDNVNNMTTTQQPTQQPTRQPTRRGDNWVAGEKLCSKLCFFFSVQVCPDPWTLKKNIVLNIVSLPPFNYPPSVLAVLLRQADLQRYLFLGRKGMFLCFYVKKIVPVDTL